MISVPPWRVPTSCGRDLDLHVHPHLRGHALRILLVDFLRRVLVDLVHGARWDVCLREPHHGVVADDVKENESRGTPVTPRPP